MRFVTALFIAAATLFHLTALANASEKASHWGYEGENGPAHWAEISPDYAACKGTQQSPINITAARDADNEDIALNWKSFAPEVLNNGHTVQANAPEGNVTSFGGETYQLLQVHFHHQSEHTIAGKHFPIEAHFVHKGGDGSLLVFAVMLESGADNPEIAKIWDVMPDHEGNSEAKADIDFTHLVPVDTKYYRYAGSLTTPPCSQIVKWVVFSKPLTVSQEQIDAFAKLYAANYRPVQAVDRRFILLGK